MKTRKYSIWELRQDFFKSQILGPKAKFVDKMRAQFKKLTVVVLSAPKAAAFCCTRAQMKA